VQVHDSGYKRLFSNRILFRDLVRTFVEEEWVAQLDFARAERVEKSFVSEHYKETEADIIYKVPLKAAAAEADGNQAVYFYLLLEFQSTVDQFMALRIGHYLLSFWLDHRAAESGLRSLPQIFPIVLYNGSNRWTAPTGLHELVEQTLDLGDYRVEVRYFPIIVNAYSLDQLLVEANAATTLFIAEAHYNAPLLMERLLWLYDQGDTQAASLLANWLRQLRNNRRITAENYAFLEQEYRSREELRMLIFESMRKADEETRRQAEAEGMAQGMAEGMQQGMAQGVAQGVAQGITQGVTIGRSARDREIAQAMAAAHYPVSEIARLLNLSEADVRNLLADQEQP
jgi:predicted transposase YdaD